LSEVRNDERQHRYEIEIGGHVAYTHYRLSPGVVTFVHTEVPKELAGRGVGSHLAAGALDDVRRRGLKVVAECPFIAAFMKKHREYDDLLVVPGG
jgi:predicted GNAT family acetyltransferase